MINLNESTFYLADRTYKKILNTVKVYRRGLQAGWFERYFLPDGFRPRLGWSIGRFGPSS